MFIKKRGIMMQEKKYQKARSKRTKETNFFLEGAY